MKIKHKFLEWTDTWAVALRSVQGPLTLNPGPDGYRSTLSASLWCSSASHSYYSHVETQCSHLRKISFIIDCFGLKGPAADPHYDSWGFIVYLCALAARYILLWLMKTAGYWSDFKGCTVLTVASVTPLYPLWLLQLIPSTLLWIKRLSDLHSSSRMFFSLFLSRQ